LSSEEDVGRHFDRFHADYDEALARGLSVSGEDKLYFARERVAFLARCLGALRYRPASVLDFGCGTGTAVPFLLRELGPERIVGVDASARSLEVARKTHESERATFLAADRFAPDGGFSLAFCNGVFHHVPPAERPGVARVVRDSLEPGGLFALWDNNPWNPGARYVMWRIPFDRGAVMLSPGEARRLLVREGFEIVRVDHLFVFPRFLRMLRPLERNFSRLPLGAQFQVLARAPR
jgi:SAM-dependent methyltransferase